jgi:post-segregation antitoxin (ccd killing protein)
LQEGVLATAGRENEMTTLELTLNLPDGLAQEAKAAGLLTPEAIEQMLKRELKRRAGELLLESARALQAVEPRLTEAEIQAEIDAARAQRRARRS